MASKQMRKEKKKLIKLKQKEIALKNKEINKKISNKTELLHIDKNEIFDLENEIEYMGLKGYALQVLKNMIDDLNSGKTLDIEIQLTARILIKFAENPNKMLKELLMKCDIKISKRQLAKVNMSQINFNTTERAFLKNRMYGVLMEYGTKDMDKQNIDYSGIRVYFEMAYRLILNGLKERKIMYIDMNTGYGDAISDLIVTYDDDDDSKYDLNANPFIYVEWNTLDNYYNTYVNFKNIYKNFSDSSVCSLTTASATAEEYESKEKGKEMISYNGVMLSYVGALEFELKKLISNKFRLSQRKLKLVDAINRLEDLNDPFLSNPKLIEDLHSIRLLRNKVAHGDSITRDEFLSVESKLISGKVLEHISWAM